MEFYETYIKGPVTIGLITILLAIVGAQLYILIKIIYRTIKEKKYKNRFPNIIVDDGYGDIHRTIYPGELIIAKLFSVTFHDKSTFKSALKTYYYEEMNNAKKFHSRKKRRRYECIAVLNIMTLIRREL